MADTHKGPRARRKGLVAAAVGLVVVAWLIVLGVMGLSAYQRDKAGLALVEQVKSDLSPGAVTSATSIALLDRAQADFAAAGSTLHSPLFAPVTIVPVVGRQLRSARSLSEAAQTVAAVGSSFLSSVHQVIAQPHSAGPERVTSLRELSAISLASAVRLRGVDTGPSRALVGPLASKHDQFVAQLDDAKRRLFTAAYVSAAVASILQGPQTYLVLAGNNAEMRAGSGAYLEVGVATTSDGSFQLGGFTTSSTRPLQPGQVPVTGDLQRNWGWLNPSLDFRNLGLTPQFDVTAPLAAQMWTAQTGQPVDGVLALDVVGLARLLQAAGPVEVGGMTVTADNVQQYLVHDQYVGAGGGNAPSNDRHDALGALAGAVLRQLQAQSTDLTSLATAVSKAVAGRHFMLWSRDTLDQAAWVASGASGTLTADSIDASVVNVGGNKLDPYLHVNVTVDTHPSGSSTQVTMETQVVNTTPSGQVPYIAGPFPGNPAPYGSYIGLIAANLPGAARQLEASGSGSGPVAIRSGEGPTWLVASSATIPQGGAAEVTTHFTLPGDHGRMRVVPSARVPAELWHVNGRTTDDGVPFTISW